MIRMAGRRAWFHALTASVSVAAQRGDCLGLSGLTYREREVPWEFDISPSDFAVKPLCGNHGAADDGVVASGVGEPG
jgi:hypothetical protein